ncbi:restriction endonuclease [Plectonema cf. radiosum LEGE 06105]|uniref:Restriction endonuclease n=1 Tax=Plectonema cf. radiosum LEGE 06105 TaxID=945769 RepID=A0A8J7F791_9CYAN|nr:restriction endonuclease [Plectonema radiosum]MBE9216735.1 restriction endonuclease [Plectonema cf. radiosum LEGE 06105]
MPIPSTSDLPKPKSWHEFEDIVWELYTRQWQDPHAQRYGRSGQAQNGIDIYGQQNSSSNYIAIQCKCYAEKKLNLQKIATEVTKADSFSSLISEYLIVTTESRDTKIQDIIRILNDERKLENKFRVHIVFWEDLCSYLAHPDNYDLLKKYYSEWEQIFANHQGIEEQKATSTRYLLSLDIQQDCKWLQELLDHNEQSYLAQKWQSCFRENRGIWQNIPSRTLLTQSINGELIQYIQGFYKNLDSIEEKCRDFLTLKLKVQPLEEKPKYESGILIFGTMHPPAWAEKYVTEQDVIALLNSKKLNAMKLKNLKKTIQTALDSGNQIIDRLSPH